MNVHSAKQRPGIEHLAVVDCIRNGCDFHLASIDHAGVAGKLRKKRRVTHGCALLGRGVLQQIFIGIRCRGGRAARTRAATGAGTAAVAASAARVATARVDHGAKNATRRGVARSIAARASCNRHTGAIGIARNVIGSRSALARQIGLRRHIGKRGLLFAGTRIFTIALVVVPIRLGVGRSRTDSIGLVRCGITMGIGRNIRRGVKVQAILCQLKRTNAKCTDCCHRSRHGNYARGRGQRNAVRKLIDNALASTLRALALGLFQSCGGSAFARGHMLRLLRYHADLLPL